MGFNVTSLKEKVEYFTVNNKFNSIYFNFTIIMDRSKLSQFKNFSISILMKIGFYRFCAKQMLWIYNTAEGSDNIEILFLKTLCFIETLLLRSKIYVRKRKNWEICTRYQLEKFLISEVDSPSKEVLLIKQTRTKDKMI